MLSHLLKESDPLVWDDSFFGNLLGNRSESVWYQRAHTLSLATDSMGRRSDSIEGKDENTIIEMIIQKAQCEV
jgi:hypothetical protein